MGRLSDAKLLGGIGSILEIIPFASIIGYILVLISVKFISDEVHDRTIFSDMIIAVVAGIVGVGVGGFVFLFLFVGTASVMSAGIGSVFGALAFLVVVWIALVASSIFVRRAYNNIAAKVNVGTFRTAGTLYLIGALLTIVLVGFLILFIAYIVQIVAFFSIQEGQQAPQGAMPAQAPVKYCPACGTQVSANAAFCPKCGAKLS